MEVNGKVAIISGASGGIGRETARFFSKKGATVVLAARRKNKLEELSISLPNSLVVPTDMTHESDIKNLVKQTMDHFGRIDIIINNAGQGYDARVEKINIETFRKIFELDVVAPVVAMKEVIPIMKKQKAGSIVNISSGTALMYLPYMGAYSSMKRALAGLSLTAREELKKDNISVSVVYPFITDTDFEKNTIKDLPEEDEAWGDESGREIPPADPPKHAAEKILEAVTSGKPEIFAHKWMKR